MTPIIFMWKEWYFKCWVRALLSVKPLSDSSELWWDESMNSGQYTQHTITSESPSFAAAANAATASQNPSIKGHHPNTLFDKMSFSALICRSPQFLAAQYYFGRRNATAQQPDDAQHGPQMWKPGEEKLLSTSCMLWWRWLRWLQLIMQDAGNR